MAPVRLRRADTEDFGFLAAMLGEAAVWRPDLPTPTGEEALADPGLARYLEDWPRDGDHGLVAEVGGRPVGAAWYRVFTSTSPGYGFVAEEVPELAIAVVAPHRGTGIGRRLLLGLLDAARADGHPALSLSVSVENPARALYESVGFRPVAPDEHTWTMVRDT